MNIVLIMVLFPTTMDNSNSYLDQFVVENLDDVIVYSQSQEVWKPEYSVMSVAGKEVVRETDKATLILSPTIQAFVEARTLELK